MIKHRVLTPEEQTFIDPLSNEQLSAGRVVSTMAGGEKKTATFARKSVNLRATKVAVKKAKPVNTEKAEYVHQLIEAAVSSNFLFRQLPKQMLQKVVGYMQRFDFTPEQIVMNEGDMGDFFYVQVRRAT